MLANLRRKLGLSSVAPAAALTPGGSTMPMPPAAEVMVPPGFVESGSVTAPLTMEELGFTAWPSDRGAFNPNSIPAWLQEQVRPHPRVVLDDELLITVRQSLTDLGLPMNGSDGVFIPLHTGGWVGDFAPMPEAW